MQKNLTVELISDVSCPWCIIGYLSFQKALQTLPKDVDVEIRWRAFELNPAMGKSGQNLIQHIVEKYGLSAEESADNRKMLVEKGKEFSFDFNFEPQTRIYNTFDAHRLLHWSKLWNKQTALKMALFRAYFSEGRDPSDHNVLVDVAKDVELDGDSARAVLASDQFKQEVRQEQEFYRQMGVEAVPTFIFNKKYVITGGQPVDAFVRALNDILQ
ncbi:DsbA family oxidoreductase [Thaumasiovibrio subtropicus]|uniref:DsbA family oxidoreductase n=1 Tax=Thaumasiovibrio subtropicus TaxID=1891207 RepID=UPI000B34B56B|nr:DsbA family oxidoreductase [Thaumasiovibrio subtropicus]